MASKAFSPAWLERHRVALPPVRRDAIVGLDHVLAELASLLARLADVEGAAALGAPLPRGVIFYGPPGTGKTLVSRYLAATLGAGTPMYELAADELSPARLRGALRHLAASRGRAVLFMDEVDQWALDRSSPFHDPETRLVLTAALAALDGLTPASGPLVIAASNRHPGDLDPALVRAGRLGVHVRFDLPDEAERAELFRRLIASRPTEEGIDPTRLGRLTRGSTPADIAGIVDDAAGIALARRARAIASDDLIAAIRRDGRVEPAEALEDPGRRHRAAVHEAGHVAVAVRLRGPGWVHAVRINAFGGHTETGPEDIGLAGVPDDVIRDSLVIGMAGLAAERLVLGEPSLAGAADVEHVTRSALDRLGAGVEATFPPVSLDALDPHAAEDLKARLGTAIADELEAARTQAAALVAAALPAIVAFAPQLDAAGELVGDELAGAIKEARFPGTEEVDA